jgi:hypothetical protein
MAQENIKPLDLQKRKFIYDGFEPDRQTIVEGFSFSEIESRPIYLLENELGKIKLEYIKETIGESVQDLPIYYYVRENQELAGKIYTFISFGEYQPARYMAHFEGSFWVKG